MRSSLPIPPAERLILALDVPTSAEALPLVERLGSEVQFYKLGLELLLGGDYFALIDALAARGARIFADVKLYDIPQTVASAVRQLAKRPVDFVTVHGDDAILAAACREKRDLKVLAVTLLTSLDARSLEELGYALPPEELVLKRARRARELGCDGVIASGLEAARLRAELGPGFLVVVPGIRATADAGGDDQRRVVSVEQAFESGADHIVVGRPIRDAADPARAAAEIQARIRALFAAG